MCGYVFCSSQTEQFHRLYNFRMGNSSRSPEDYEIVSRYREGDWTHELSEQGVRIWRNRLTNETAELVRLNSLPSGEDLDIYTTRTMENDLVKVYHLLMDSQSDLCSLYNSASLLIQLIPIRLSTLHNFDREEALTIFASALRGFHLLQIKFGPIVPHEELIGFNDQGKTKVWINRDNCRNFADRRNYSEEFQQVSRRVQVLFEMIEQRARYVLLPPVIKEEIYQPLSSHLTALKALEKFAYYEKLNLRKYLQFAHHTAHQSARPPQRSHTRNRSYFTEAKPEVQICCEQNESSVFSSGAKQNELRRNYSLNSIPNQPGHFYAAPQIIPRRSNLQTMIKQSRISNNSSYFDSARPSTIVYHCNYPGTIPTAQHVRNYYHRQGVVSVPQRMEAEPDHKVEVQISKFQVQNIETHPETPETLVMKQQPPQMSEKEQIVAMEPKTALLSSQPQVVIEEKKAQIQECKPLISKSFSIIDKVSNQIIEQIKIKQFESVEEPIDYQASIEPKSPTFPQDQEIKFDFLSFAPSRQNFEEEKNSDPYPIIKVQNELNMDLLNDRIRQEQAADKKFEDDEQRRLSIENKASKLVFSPDFVLNTGSLLNYCTSVQSKLHMATNREHSIIEPKSKEQEIPVPLHEYQDEQIEQYIRQKYIKVQKEEPKQPSKPREPQYHSKVKRIESKYISLPQTIPPKNIISAQKTHPNAKYEISLGSFPVEQDFLDVNYLEKSLDKRYNNQHHHTKAEQKRKQMEENDALNIAKLEEGLLRFSKSQLNQKNTEIQSKEPTRKHEHSEKAIQPSTAYDSYNPFKEKKYNEETVQDVHLHEKSLNRNHASRRSSKYHENKSKQRYPDQHRQYEDNINEYSFEENARSPYSASQQLQNPNRNYHIKQAQYSGNEYSPRGDYVYSHPTSVKGIQPRSSVQDEDGRSSSKTKNTSNRKISYEQLRQFLWN